MNVYVLNFKLILGNYLLFSGQHEEVLVVRKDCSIERLDTFDLGFMVGLEEDIAQWVHHQEICLHPGDGVVLYTDGITEATDSDGKFFGIEQLCDIVQQSWQASAIKVQTAVIEAVQAHIGNDKPLDDITLVVVKQKD